VAVALLLGFELPVADFFAAGFVAAGFDAAGFDAVGSAGRANGTHSTANAAANNRARAREASMGRDSTRPRAAPHNLR
jgi:hypothetical protein